MQPSGNPESWTIKLNCAGANTKLEKSRLLVWRMIMEIRETLTINCLYSVYSIFKEIVSHETENDKNQDKNFAHCRNWIIKKLFPLRISVCMFLPHSLM